MVKQGRSSDVLKELYGEIDHYKKILKPYQEELIKQYPNDNLEKYFTALGDKMIAIAPMAFCENMLLDLGEIANDIDLAALGLHMLAISTHDDVVDELPRDRIEVAALTYVGNIATNEGSKLLIRQNHVKAAVTLLDTINKNHYYQQHVAETLWQHAPNSFDEYKDGVNHICVFISIGLKYALALANRLDLENQIEGYSNGYGIALQLFDDLREVEEDKMNGYRSFPIVEGEPYNESFKHLFESIKSAREAIPGGWRNLQRLLNNLEKFALNMKK